MMGFRKGADPTCTASVSRGRTSSSNGTTGSRFVSGSRARRGRRAAHRRGDRPRRRRGRARAARGGRDRLAVQLSRDEHERALAERCAGDARRAGHGVLGDRAGVPRVPAYRDGGVNAGLRPIVGRYRGATPPTGFARAGRRGPFLVMQSNGGCVPAERAAREAHRLLLSGPAGGRHGRVALVAGTGSTARLVRHGRDLARRLPGPGRRPADDVDADGRDHPILGAVGRHRDGRRGRRQHRVGRPRRSAPRRARRAPAPTRARLLRAGRDGRHVTDAHVVGGHPRTDDPLAGRLTLDARRRSAPSSARRASASASTRGRGEGDLGGGAAHTSRALRRVSVERGIDPREYTLVAFGGAGPLHAGRCWVSSAWPACSCPRIPGLFSAAGLVAADLRIDDAQTMLWPLERGRVPTLLAWYRDARDTPARPAPGGRHPPIPDPGGRERRLPVRGPGLRAQGAAREGLEERAPGAPTRLRRTARGRCTATRTRDQEIEMVDGAAGRVRRLSTPRRPPR